MSRRQLIAAGVGAGAIKERTASGVLIVVHRGVYALGTPSVRGLLRAGLLAAADGAALSHRSAAYLHRLIKDFSQPVHVSTGRHVRSRRGLAVHRTSLSVTDRTKVAGLAATTVPRTLVDLAATTPRRFVERAIDEALRLELCEEETLHAARQLRAILAEHAPGTTFTRSELEEAFLALCGRSGIPQPRMNAPLVLPSAREISVDALWPAERVAVELDARAAHLRRKAFESDRQRDVELTVAGYLPARFTWLKVTCEPRWVAAQVRGLLARAGA